MSTSLRPLLTTADCAGGARLGEDVPVTAQATDQARRQTIAIGAAVVAMVIMSSGPSIVKRSDLHGLPFAFWRLWLAAALYAGLTVLRGQRLGLRHLRLSLAGGAFFGLNIAAFFTSVKLTSAANATVISALQPALTLLVVGPFLGEWPRKQVVAWTAVAIFGVSLAVFGGADSGTGDLVGDAWAFFAMVMFTGYYFASKRARIELDTVTYTAGMLVVASVVLTPIALASSDPIGVPPADEWIWIAFMVLLPGTGHALTNYSHAFVSMTVMALIALLGPVLSALYAWWLIDETLSWVQIVGMAVVILALAVVVTGQRAVPAPATTPAEALARTRWWSVRRARRAAG